MALWPIWPMNKTVATVTVSTALIASSTSARTSRIWYCTATLACTFIHFNLRRPQPARSIYSTCDAALLRNLNYMRHCLPGAQEGLKRLFTSLGFGKLIKGPTRDDHWLVWISLNFGDGGVWDFLKLCLPLDNLAAAGPAL